MEASMLQRENNQKDFFDDYVYRRLLPEKHILLDIKSKIDFSFVEEVSKPLYSDNMGRPSFPPAVLFKMLFLEFFYSLSDYEIVDQVKTNILFRYFTGLAITEDTPDDTTLVVFRKRLGETRFKKLFDEVVIKAKDMGIIEGKLKILDATHIHADIALQGSVNFLRDGKSKVVKKIEKTDPEEASRLKERYVNENKLYGSPDESEIKKEIDLTREFINQTKSRFSEDIEELIELLDTATYQQVKKIYDPKHKEQDEIVSFTDKDARYGHKSEKKRFVGYKAHASMDDASGIVTSAITITGNKNEGSNKEVKEILREDESKNMPHQAVVADSLYDSYDNRNRIHKLDMRAFIPRRTKTRKKMVQLENFIYDDKEDTLICPKGHSPISKTKQEKGTLFIFSTHNCKYCRNLYNCSSGNLDRTRIFVSNDYRLYLIDNIPDKKEAIIKRKGIERKFGEAKKWHGMDRARYRERWRVAIQVFMTFLVVNIKRMVKLLSPAPQYALSRSGFG